MDIFRQSSRFWLQALMVAVVTVFFGTIAFNVASNLQRQSLHFGLDFLGRPAGFSVLQTLIPFNETSTYGKAFVVGLLNTLLVAVVGAFIATLLGFALGFARVAPSRVLQYTALGYVELVRNIPLLLILFFLYFGLLRQLPPPRQSFSAGGMYLNNRGLFLPFVELGFLHMIVLAVGIAGAAYAIRSHDRFRWIAITVVVASVGFFTLFSPVVIWPQLKGLSVAGGAKLIPEAVALTAALSIYAAAYIAEIVRAGIQAVPQGQVEAAEALGLSGWQRARLVVLPQALRLIVPPLTSQYLNLTKNSSLAVAIAYPDLVSVFTGTTLAQTGQAVEIVGITMAVYLTLSLLTAFALNAPGRRAA